MIGDPILGIECDILGGRPKIKEKGLLFHSEEYF